MNSTVANWDRLTFKSPIMWVALSCIVAAGLSFEAIQRPRTISNQNARGSGKGNLIVLGAKDDLQEAINRAMPGDTIVLEAGAVFTGPFLLPKKSGASYITIQTSRIAELPENVRVGPSQAALFAKLQTTRSEPVIETASGAHHYKFVGVEFSSSAPQINDLIRLGQTGKPQRELASVPNNLVIDRCYLHGFPAQEIQRGISLNSATTEITNSYISDIHGLGYDSQAICGWNGPGPFLIVNNYLEAAGENVMFGGADPTIPNLVPSDIQIRHNHFFKPLSWKPGNVSAGARHWSVKNLLELKNARTVVIDSNVFENCWVDAQVGYAIVLTVRNQAGAAPWSTIENVDFSNNIVKNAAAGINLLGSDNEHPSARATGLNIQNNLFNDISGNFLQINGYNNVSVIHNTHFQNGNIMSLYGDPSSGFVYKDNITVRAQKGYGIKGDATGEGTIALNIFAPGSIVKGNLLIQAKSAEYPRENFFPSTPAEAGLLGMSTGDFRLSPRSPYRSRASDHKDPGCDFGILENTKSATQPASINR